MDADTTKKIEKIIRKHKASRTAVIGILQDIQREDGFLSEAAITYVSKRLGIPPSRAFAVATFYGAFSLTPQGRNRIHVCQGTACHIRGGGNLADHLSRTLRIQTGETTKDMKFSLHKVRCLGCCALAPVVKVNDDIHANVAQQQIPSILENYT